TVREVQRDLERNAGAIGYDEDTRLAIEQAFAFFAAILPDLHPTPDDLVGRWRLDPDAIAKGLMQRAEESAKRIAARPDHAEALEAGAFLGSDEARRHIAYVFERTTELLAADPDLNEKLDPVFKRRVLAELGLLRQVAEDTAAIRE